MSVTLTEAEAQLAAYLEAERRVLRNQSYQLPSGRAVSRANLKEIQDGIRQWTITVQQLKAGGIRVRGAVPA